MKRLFLLAAAYLVCHISLLAQKTIDARDFHTINLAISADVILMQGDYQVKVEGPAEQVDKLKIEVADNALNIGMKKDSKWGNNWKSDQAIKIYVTMPQVKALNLAGSGDIVAQDAFNGLGDLEISVAGSGDVSFKGSAKKVAISVAGNGDVDASNLNATQCNISVAGNGDVLIGTTEVLSVSIAGNGDVSYKGEPQKLEKSIMGNGDVHRM
ncbi:MAG TPA: head GIN domain-containing protein [Saprospiraceae bacterium]|nr:head GIN domain-containing protein [Saprospiraceae bacterium]HMQ82323.1 head GIN domain-containing protein [Saprospiraceae bacterium]